MNFSTEANELAKRIATYKAAYYAGAPLISDQEYDWLEAKLAKIAKDHPELKIVGGELSSKFAQATTGEAMLGLDKTRDPEQLRCFISEKEVIVDYKIDGGSCELRYRDGWLTEAVSRGRGGELGFVVTKNALHLANVPHFIKDFTGEIRGEVYILWSEFEGIKKQCEIDGEDIPSHPRNTACGKMRQEDSKEVQKNKLRFMAYRIVGQEDEFPTEVAVRKFLDKVGFITPGYQLFSPGISFLAKMNVYLDEWKARLDRADFACDGIVFTVNDRKQQKKLGVGTSYPHWALAFKWENETAETTLEDIEWEVSRSGRINPTGIIKPTDLSGAVLTRCTLHNVGLIRANDIKIGSTILIIRSGEIIPKFLDTIAPGTHHKIPDKCPSCGGPIVEEVCSTTTEGSYLWCRNKDCPAQILEQINHYVSIAEIDALGKGRAEALYEQGIVKTITDLYLLPARDLSGVLINGKTLGKKNGDKIKAAIEKASILPLHRFIAALGIEDVGLGTAEKIVEKYTTYEEILKLTVADLQQLPGFNERAHTIVKSLQKKLPLMKALKAFVTFRKPDAIIVTNVLNGKKFVVTGTLSNPREEIEALIKAAGGVLQSGVSGSTDYLVVGEEPGKGKTDKAKIHGTPVISEEELMDLMAVTSKKAADDAAKDDE